MKLELHMRIVGVLMLLLVVVNLYVPRHFGWRDELRRLTLFTRQVFVVHAAFIILVLAMMGVLSLCFASELVQPTPLARVVLAGLTVFWFARLLVQWLVYDHRLWVGHRFNTTMHLIFTMLWGYFVVVYGWGLWLQFRV